MELTAAIRGRRMVRSFTPQPVDPAVLDALLDLARRAPSAGHTQALDLVVLVGAETAAYWDVTLPPVPPERRAGFRWPGLLAAPVLVLPVVHPGAYPARYAEPDKAATGLGDGEAAWPVPYWWIDGGAAVEHLLLGAVDAGLGACLFGTFGHEPAVRAALGIPDDRRMLGAVALGHPSAEAGAPDQRGRSADRPRRPLDQIVHRSHW